MHRVSHHINMKRPFRNPAFAVLACLLASTPALAATASAVGFDGARAYNDLVAQVSFGPRLPESPALEQTRKYILDELGRDGFTTGTQDFQAFAPLINRQIRGRNIYGISGPGTARVALSAHYDSRPYADMDKDPSRRKMPVPGANDGASGVAVLLEIARNVRALQPSSPVALIFFDAEDLGFPTDDAGFCLGSRFMAANMPPGLKFEQGINLDMVGDADLQFPMEGNSLRGAPTLVRSVWAIGKEKYPNVFVEKATAPIFDDHIPFLKSGRPFIDIIDFDYSYWHTVDDSADKCSPESLKTIGDVLLDFLKR